MSDGAVVKVKSDWWFRAGYCQRYRDGAKEWQAMEARRRLKMQARRRTRGQRLAVMRVTGVSKPTDIFTILPGSQRLEVVYNRKGKFSVVVVSFDTEQEMENARAMATTEGWRVQQAYSNRTRGKVGRRLEIYERDGIAI